VLAAQASAAAAASQREEQLEAALGNRLVIGQAQGMLMQRYHLSAEQAFSVLTRASQDANRKLVEICRQLIEEGADLLDKRSTGPTEPPTGFEPATSSLQEKRSTD
jgi:AmiR/NasT family two-component response regulator